MEEWIMDILEEERRKRNIPLEVRVLNGNYYLYHSTSRSENINMARRGTMRIMNTYSSPYTSCTSRGRR
jgi:hypothetical protein